MRPTRVSTFSFLCVLCVLRGSPLFAAEPQFTISYWCGPPAAFNTLERYQQIKDAGFTIAMPACGKMSVRENHKMLEYCQQVGLRAIVHDSRMPMATDNDPKAKPAIDAIIKDYSGYPALYGYFITDEPGAGQFIGLGQVVAYLKEKDPSHIGFINLLPTYARAFNAISTTYEEHVESFAKTVKPFAISYDHYHFKSHGDREDFFENLYTVRNIAHQFDIPFWNIVLNVQHFDYRHLTEPELRFEAMQTLAFGAHGLLWFTYWSPAEPNDKTPVEKRKVNWEHAIINPDGSKDPHYDMIKAINADVLAIGNELLPCKSTEVFLQGKPVTTRPSVAKKSPPTRPSDHSPIKMLSETDLTVGVFRAPDGGHLALIANRDYKDKSAARATISPANAAPELFDPTTKNWSPAPIRERGVVEVILPPGGATLLRW